MATVLLRPVRENTALIHANPATIRAEILALETVMTITLIVPATLSPIQKVQVLLADLEHLATGNIKPANVIKAVILFPQTATFVVRKEQAGIFGTGCAGLTANPTECMILHKAE